MPASRYTKERLANSARSVCRQRLLRGRRWPELGQPTRFLQHPSYDDGKRQAWQAHEDERPAPAPGRRYLGAEHEADQVAGRGRSHEDCERPAALGRVEVVGDQRLGGRNCTRLTGADAHAGQSQLPEGLRHAAERRHRAPDDQRHRNDEPAITAVGPACDGNAEGRVEESEGEAGQQAQHRVGDLELGLDGLEQYRDHVAVDVVRHRHQEQDGEVGPALAGRVDRPGLALGGGVHAVLQPGRPAPATQDAVQTTDLST